ncbi:MAG TPA: hypothetical protein VGK89_05385 [Candidatus Eisenbacteria bacterium]
MRRRALLPALVALAALSRAPAAGAQPSRAEVLLTRCPSRETLRASLLRYADSARVADPAGAGEALYLAGASCLRASLRDSAIECFRRADSLRHDPEDRLSLVDALLLRQGPGDLEAATALLDPAGGDASYDFEARRAWVEFLAGRTAKSVEIFRRIQASFDLDPVWGYRMARAFVEAGDVKRALTVLQPLAVASRQQDAELMDLAERAFQSFGNPVRLENELGRQISARDQSEGKLSQALGGRRVRFTAPDGAALGAVLVPARRSAHPRAAVVLWAPRDTLASYDSLAVALSGAGWAVLLMEARGSGWSAGPDCPFPEAWIGREDAMQSACARDVHEALRVLAVAGHADTMRCLLAGVGPTAATAVEAAELDRRVQALLLLSPAPDPVERGPMRERIHRLQRPIYFSGAPEDYLEFEVTNALYQAGDRGASRVADVSGAGTGARPFRDDLAAVRRLIAWLEETMPARAATGSRPGAPRRR